MTWASALSKCTHWILFLLHMWECLRVHASGFFSVYTHSRPMYTFYIHLCIHPINIYTDVYILRWHPHLCLQSPLSELQTPQSAFSLFLLGCLLGICWTFTLPLKTVTPHYAFPILINGNCVYQVSQMKNLGVILDSFLFMTIYNQPFSTFVAETLKIYPSPFLIITANHRNPSHHSLLPGSSLSANIPAPPSQTHIGVHSILHTADKILTRLFHFPSCICF